MHARLAIASLLAIACEAGGERSTSVASSDTGDSSGAAPVSSGDDDGVMLTSSDATTTRGSSYDGTSAGSTSLGSDSESTGVPVPAFDELPWQTGDAIGYGIAYKDSEDPSARNVFIGYAGYPFPLDASQSWATALYHARLQELGVRHVYAVQGPATVGYEDLEIGNTHIAEALATQAVDAQFVIVAGHSSGSYVAHELLGQLEGGWDPTGVTADKVVYFDLDGGTAGLYAAAVARLRRAYFVSVWDGSTATGAPNRDAMQYLGDVWSSSGEYVELDGSGSGCNAGAAWCLHMAVINSLPHDPNDSDVIDYFDFVDRPVVTTYIDLEIDEAGLHP
jgi:hypothetical protein